MDGSTSTECNNGCFVCRSRKVRCDRAPLACWNCRRLGVQCPGYARVPHDVSRKELATSVAGIFEASGVAKRRVGACEECRKVKTRCTRSQPACGRCVRKRVPCVYASASASSHARSQSRPESQPQHMRSHVRPQTETPSQALDPSPPSLFATVSPSVDLALSDAPMKETRPGAAGAAAIVDQDMAWVFDQDLPAEQGRLGLLLNYYFDRLHHIWCLGFIHKPSFMQSFDQGRLFQDYGEPLVYILCALGLQLYYYDNINRLGHIPAHTPGASWAEKARKGAMEDIVRPTPLTLMNKTLLLACEYAIRADEHAAAFLLIACCYRIIRLLRLDSPRRYIATSSKSDFTQLESELRSVWSCYIFDSFIGSGIDSNLQWKDSMPDVPLPSPEANFLSQTQSPTSRWIRMDADGNPPTEMRSDLKTNLISLVRLRTKVLKLIRRRTLPTDVWQPGSPFLDLLAQLEAWHRALPAELLPSTLNIYIQKELHSLAALFGLHFVYHSTVTDLTRVALPGFDFPLAELFRGAPPLFRRQCQQRCRFHADEVARLVRLGFQVVGPEAFDDPHCAVATFESTKIQIVHTATTAAPDGARLRREAVENIRDNLRLLAVVNAPAGGPNAYLRALFPLLSRFSFHEITAEWPQMEMAWQTEEAEVTGPAEADYLGKMSSFRMATSEVHSNKDQQAMSSEIPAVPDPQHAVPMSAEPPAVLGMYGGGHAAADAMPGSGDDATFADIGDALLPLMTDEMMAEHIRLAEEMSSYITWDTGEF